MTRDDVRLNVVLVCGVVVGIAGGVKAFPWVPDYWQHVMALSGLIAATIAAKLGNSPLPGDNEAGSNDMPKWLQILAKFGPEVLAFTPLAPIAGVVVAGIQTAEAIPGATGEQKKALVQQIVALGAQGTNAQAGHVVIDPAAAAVAAQTAIDTVVNVTNIVHAAHPDVVAPAA